MGDTGLFVDGAVGCKAKAFVKADGMGLCAQVNFWQALLLCLGNQGFKQQLSEPTGAPRFSYSHATDLSARKEASASDGLALCGAYEQMKCGMILFVDLDLGGDVLFFDKDFASNQIEIGLIVGPTGDMECGHIFWPSCRGNCCDILSVSKGPANKRIRGFFGR